MYFNYQKIDTKQLDIDYYIRKYVQTIRLEKKALTQDLPECPGVYVMKDARDEILYIGKSKNLKKRVQSYFNQSKNHSRKIMKMVVQVRRVDYLVTGTELEALLLESRMIKEKMPLYNKQLRNYKAYGYIKLTCYEDYPRLIKADQITDDGAMYYGPYSNSTDLEVVIDALQTSVGLRRCYDNSDRLKGCLYHQIGDCISPCIELDCKEKYAEAVKAVQLFLDGKSSGVIRYLEKRRNLLSQSLKFEQAGYIQTKIESLEKFFKYCNDYIYSVDRRNVALIFPNTSQKYITILLIMGGRLRETYSYEAKKLLETGIQEIKKDYLSGLEKDLKHICKSDVDEMMIIGRWLKENQNYSYIISLDNNLDALESTIFKICRSML